MSRFRQFFLSADVVEAALKWTPKIIPSSGVDVSGEPRHAVLRLVLPCSDRYVGLARELNDLAKAWSGVFESLGLGFRFRFAIAWSRGAKPLWQRLRLPIAPDVAVLQHVRRLLNGR